MPLRSQYLLSIGLVLLVSVVCFHFTAYMGYKMTALWLLLTVSLLAMLFDILPVLVSAVLSAVIWNFFFIPPLFTFHIGSAEDVLMFLLYFIVALINATLTFKIREAEKKARDKEEKENTIKLYNTLLNSLSHELKTPISTIQGSVDTLLDDKHILSKKHQLELLNGINAASIRLGRQVGNLLNMSRLEGGMLKPKNDWCDMNEMIYAVLNKVSTENHSIDFLPDENLPLFKLDAGLLEQALYNLVYNAIQYTPSGSVISFWVGYFEGHCIIKVSDNGAGFPQQNIQQVFEKFYRIPNTRPGGSGLGLSIVKGFVEAMGGTVQLENNAQSGATFTLDIPAEVTYISNLKHE